MASPAARGADARLAVVRRGRRRTLTIARRRAPRLESRSIDGVLRADPPRPRPRVGLRASADADPDAGRPRSMPAERCAYARASRPDRRERCRRWSTTIDRRGGRDRRRPVSRRRSKTCRRQRGRRRPRLTRRGKAVDRPRVRPTAASTTTERRPHSRRRAAVDHRPPRRPTADRLRDVSSEHVAAMQR